MRSDIEVGVTAQEEAGVTVDGRAGSGDIREGRGRALRWTRRVSAALAAGDISPARARGLAALAADHSTCEAFGRDEALLVGYARELHRGDLERAVARWQRWVDPGRGRVSPDERAA